MDKYLFLDNWVFSKLRDNAFNLRISELLLKSKCKIMATSSLFTELYNPNWQEAGNKDRSLYAAKLLCNNPCVIVDPVDIFEEEYKLFPERVRNIPVRLEFNEMSPEMRYEAILRFLHRDPLYLNQGKDIGKWQINTNEHKASWLGAVQKIIDKAVENEYLEKDGDKYYCKSDMKEVFLFWLDVRLANGYNPASFSEKLREAQSKGLRHASMRGARVTSLSIYYAYINVDPANKIKTQGSDVVDILHLALLPYSSIFTVDNNMKRILEKVALDINISNCILLSPQNIIS
jgi:hypothetical protein